MEWYIQEFKLHSVKRGRNRETDFSYTALKNKKGEISKEGGVWPSAAKGNQNGQSGLRLCKGHNCGADKFEHDLINGGESLSLLQQENSTKKGVLYNL